MIPFIGPLISAVTSLGGSYLERKTAESKGKARVAVAKAEGDINWDIEQAKASNASWKDEYLCVLVSIPLICAWIPGLENHIQRGFEVLERMPQWYQAILLLAFSASFGYRGLMKFMGRKK